MMLVHKGKNTININTCVLSVCVVCVCVYMRVCECVPACIHISISQLQPPQVPPMVFALYFWERLR